MSNIQKRTNLMSRMFNDIFNSVTPFIEGGIGRFEAIVVCKVNEQSLGWEFERAVDLIPNLSQDITMPEIKFQQLKDKAYEILKQDQEACLVITFGIEDEEKDYQVEGSNHTFTFGGTLIIDAYNTFGDHMQAKYKIEIDNTKKPTQEGCERSYKLNETQRFSLI